MRARKTTGTALSGQTGRSARRLRESIATFRLTPKSADPSLRPSKFGLWLSLVERFVRVEEVQGSNPCSPTIPEVWAKRERRAGKAGNRVAA